MMRFFLIGLLLFLAPGTEPRQGGREQTDNSAQVEGFIVSVGASSPVSRAAVVLRSADDAGGIRATAFTGIRATAFTDASGKFAFSNVPPGTYDLSASREGYVSGAYQEERPGGPGASFVVQVSELLSDMNIGLVPTGVISGYIEDRFGQPMVGASVRALQFAYAGPDRILSEVSGSLTNDRGEYRLYWLEAGDYLISVLPRDNLPIVGPFVVGSNQAGPPPSGIEASGAGRTQRFIPVYYPGTVDPAFASVLNVGPGIDYTGVNMRVNEVSTVRVRGRVVSGVGGDPPVRPTVRLVPPSTVAGSRIEPTDIADPDGTFELIAIVPGTYNLVAIATQSQDSDFGPGEPSQSTRGQRLFAQFPIDVGNADIDNLIVNLLPGFGVSGRVYLESAPGQQPVEVGDVRVSLSAARIRYGVSLRSGVPAADGSFQIDNVPPNDYRIEIFGLPAKAYLKEVRLGVDGVLDSGLQIMGPPRGELSLLIAQDAGHVMVSVVDAEAGPASGVRVVLVPDSPRRGRADLYKVATTENGSASFDDVPPGEYKLFSWEQVQEGAWRNADFLRDYDEFGTPVTLAPSGTASATARLIQAP
jgi:hypothetical protein